MAGKRETASRIFNLVSYLLRCKVIAKRWKKLCYVTSKEILFSVDLHVDERQALLRSLQVPLTHRLLHRLWH
jgi:hypothetical protein